MLEMERIRVRILHENKECVSSYRFFQAISKLSKSSNENSLRKPYDGVFNQSDDMILLSLFMRVITGQTPSLPSLGD